MSTKFKIPFAKPFITRKERRAVDKVLRSGQLGAGKVVEEFEEQFAQYTGAKYAVAVSSGTAALFLSLKALGIKEGDRVGVPSITFTASASVIRHCNAIPVFTDITINSLTINTNPHLENPTIKALVSVALTGNPSMTMGGRGGPVNIPTIIDSAHKINKGCHYGDLQTYSFHPTKNMTTGFGGMVTTDNEEYAKYIRKARRHGCIKYDSNEPMNARSRRWGYDVEFCGWKMNMTNIQAAMGIEQLKRLDEMNRERQRCIDRYNKNLGFMRTGLHLYPVFVEDRERFMTLMELAGIQCSVHFQPLHKMKAYEDLYTPDLPVTDWVGERIVSLPLFPQLKDHEIDYVCQKVKTSGLLISQ